MYQAFCCNFWFKQVQDTVYKSIHLRACQCLPCCVQFKLVGHSWFGIYKPLASMLGLAICLFQDLCFKFGISFFLPLSVSLSITDRIQSVIYHLIVLFLHQNSSIGQETCQEEQVMTQMEENKKMEEHCLPYLLLLCCQHHQRQHPPRLDGTTFSPPSLHKY